MASTFGYFVIELLGTIFILVASFYIYFKYFLYNYWQKKGIAYLEPTVPMGNFANVVRGKISIGELYANSYAEKKNNRCFGMYAFYKPSLVIVDPDLIRHVLTKEFVHFHDRGMYCNETIDPLSGHLFLLSGRKWRNLRAKLTPTFTATKMRQMFVIVVDCGKKLSSYLKPKADKREIIEIKDLFARFSTDVITSTAFGISCNSVENPNSAFRYWGRKSFEAHTLCNALGGFAPKIMEFFSIPATDRGVSKFFTTAFEETVKYREANNITRPDFMNLLIQLMKKGYVERDKEDKSNTIDNTDTTGGKISMMEGAAQAFVFFLAGFETSSSTITYCLYELARNQHIQDEVMKDIDAALEKYGGLTYESLRDMTYLHKVISETLRKYPPLPVLNRVCTKDIILPSSNLNVSKGLDVVIPVLGIHMDPNIYPEPEKFDPERFNEDNIASRHPYTYLPFGEGPRICIGMRFGYAQTKVGLISMLSKYRVKLSPKTSIPLELDPRIFVMTAKGGVDLIVEPR